MVAVLLNSTIDDDARRRRLYSGDLFLYGPRQSTLVLCALARELLEEAFHPYDPREAQYHFPVEKYSKILSQLKPALVHHPECKRLLPAILKDYGCSLGKTYFDVPRLRTSTSDGYLTTGIAFAFHPHRDTWYSAPMCQLNWWLPIYGLLPESGMAFHPGYWSKGIENSSEIYNYGEWIRTSRFNAAKHIGRDTRKQPEAQEPSDLDSQFTLAGEAGSLFVFAAAQMHSSMPNNTGETRISIDFRTVHLDDVRNGDGAPNVDSHCTGTTMGNYLNCSTLKHIPEGLVQQYENGFGR